MQLLSNQLQIFDTSEIHLETICPVLTSERVVYAFDGDGHEFPALPADVSTAAAGSDVIIVGHVDIEH